MSVGIFNAETNETKDVADKARAAILDNEIHGNGLKDASDKPSFVDYYALCFPKDNEKSPVHVAMHAALLNKIFLHQDYFS